MNGVGVAQPKNPAWPSFLARAVLFSLAWSVPAAAQRLDPPTEAGRPASPAGAAPADLPPSSVSPAIARFLKESRRDEASAPLAPTATFRTAADVPSSASPGRPPTDPAGDPVLGDLPPAIPITPPPDDAPRSVARPAERPNPLAATPDYKAAPIAPGDRRFPINLATALRLADARPLVVAAAQASVWLAEAELTRSKILWLPKATFALDYIRHDGGGPDFNKGIMTAPSVNYFYGGFGLTQSVNLTDVIYRPLASRQALNSRQWDVQTAKNDALLQTADAYFLVHQFRGSYSGSLYTVSRGRALVEKMNQLSKELTTGIEISRAKNLLADLEQRAVLARQEWRVQSANLTQVLRLDPRAVVEPLELDHTQITLVDPGRALDDLLPVALRNRPELASREALVKSAEYDVKREKNRPLLPLILINGFQNPGNQQTQAGLFGIGYNSSFSQLNGRVDVSYQVMWQLEGLGIGNLARVKAQRGQQSNAIIELRRAQDRVAAEINRAQARVQSAAARIGQADRALRTGIVTFNGGLEGLGQTKRFGNVLVLAYRPQEVIYSLDLLDVAIKEYYATVADYNRAQFELFHALGYPAREIADLRPPGEVIPVDTDRPSFLPPVGNGPPPATR